MKAISAAGLGLLALVFAVPSYAQDIQIADVAELSGGGATVGTNWKNGIDLAVEEVNAAGGILGHKIVVTHAELAVQPWRGARPGAEGA